jgi:ADP-ribosylglycohydrolase
VTFDERDPDNLKDTLIQAVEIGRKAPDVFAARAPLYESCLQYHPIDPQEVFSLTFGIFAAAKGDTRAGIVGGANIGRDADTIPSLNGQILGALNGIDSAPKEWVEGLEKTRSHEPLHRTAVGMTELLVRRTREAQARAAEVDAML